MLNIVSARITQFRGGMVFASLLAGLLGSWPSAARQQGPQTVNVAPAPTAGSKTDSSNISTKPPDIPVDQIIKKFGDRELEFKKERDNYTYTQTFVVQTIDMEGHRESEEGLSDHI